MSAYGDLKVYGVGQRTVCYYCPFNNNHTIGPCKLGAMYLNYIYEGENQENICHVNKDIQELFLSLGLELGRDPESSEVCEKST